MKPEPRREFVARGTAYKDEASIPVTIVGGYRPLETGPVKCKVIPELENCPWGLADINIGDIENNQHRIQLQGRTEFDEDIWIPRYRITTTSADEHQVSLEGVAEFFVEGSLAEFDASGGTIICSAYVPPTPIALANVVYMPSYDGTITIEQGKREGVRWNTDLGEAELTDNYTYYWDRVGLDRARVQVQQCQIEIKVQGTKDVSLRSFCERLPGVLDEPLWLLSFLSRKRVAWYRAQVVFYPGDGPTRNFREAVLRREQWLGYEYEQTQEVSELDLLVKVQALREGLFERLCENYKASPSRDCIHRSIPYLLMSHGRSYIEPRIGIAYSALEGLVASLSEETEITYLLGASQFDKLSKKLRAFIRQEMQEDKSVAAGIIKKIPELRRASFTDRLLELVKQYDLDISRLWPSGVDTDSELHQLIKRRNVFIHQGRIDDYSTYIVDFYRIVNLVELWILQLIGCPDTAINYNALNHPIPINKQ